MSGIAVGRRVVHVGEPLGTTLGVDGHIATLVGSGRVSDADEHRVETVPGGVRHRRRRIHRNTAGADGPPRYFVPRGQVQGVDVARPVTDDDGRTPGQVGDVGRGLGDGLATVRQNVLRPHRVDADGFGHCHRRGGVQSAARRQRQRRRHTEQRECGQRPPGAVVTDHCTNPAERPRRGGLCHRGVFVGACGLGHLPSFGASNAISPALCPLGIDARERNLTVAVARTKAEPWIYPPGCSGTTMDPHP